MARDQRIRHAASVAPATVRAVSAAGAIQAQRKARRPPRTTAPAQPVTVERLDDELRAIARRLAGGDMARVEILSTTEVRVHNGPTWRRR